MKLSIIIPMYNAEPYIRKCLASCLDQDLPFTEYEIVVVDDGSGDGGPAIVEEVAAVAASEGKAMVRVLRQAIAGQGAARNRALEIAEGDYIWFVDADDWIRSRCLAELLSLAEGFDVLAFGATNYAVSEGNLVAQDVFSYPEDRVTTGREHFIRVNERVKVCPPFYLFRRTFLLDHSLRFPVGLFHEDAQFTPEAVLLAGPMRITRGTYYGRLIRAGSTMQSLNFNRIRNLHSVAANLMEFKVSQKMDTTLGRAFDSYLSNIVNQSNKLVLHFSRIAPERREELFREQNAWVAGLPWLPGVLCNSMQLKYRLEGWLFRIFPRKMMQIYRFLLFFKG